MTDKPEWQARNESDRERMHRWVNERLDEIEKTSANRRGSGYAVLKAYIASDAPAIEAAERGDIKPLRQRYPHLTRYLHAPKLGRGEKYKKAPTFDAAREAADDTDRIRDTWKEHYEGRWKRQKDDGPSAIAIAARRWYVSEDAVVEVLKRRKRQEFSPKK